MSRRRARAKVHEQISRARHAYWRANLILTLILPRRSGSR